MIATIFKRVEWGLFWMIALIPQPNIYFKFNDYPLGKDFLDFLFIAIVIGIILQKKGFVKTNNTKLIIALIVVSYLALWNSSMRFSLPLPITHSNKLLYEWKNYVQMICMYFLVLIIIKNEDQQKALVVLMTLVVLFMAVRGFRGFTGGEFFTGKRYDGSFWIVGLGANHFGAFFADYLPVFIGLFLFDTNKKRRWLFLATVLFGIHPLFFAYSRGAYVAAFGALIFFGLIKKRILLIVALVIILSWKTLLPSSVVDRITMTQNESGKLEHSAAVRLYLWDHAMNLFKKNPIFGVGFGGFKYMAPEDVTLTDTHNVYLKFLSEQGVIGFSILLLVFYGAFRSGLRLYKTGKTQFQKGLALGFLGCVVAIMITNMFGERWSYFVLGSYFWIFWGLVDRGLIIAQSEKAVKINERIEGKIVVAGGA